MARKILFAEIEDRENPVLVKVDDVIDVQWKHRPVPDGYSLRVDPPSYDITHRARGEPVARVSDHPSQQWIDKATSDDPTGGVVGRINEIVYRDGERDIAGFNIEFLTGVDARAFVAAEKRADTLAALKRNWWLVLGVLIFIWWWMA
ncbi:hypothetical protein HLH89_32445 [Rhizobium laguerreae]|uniref:hypothetical protein n=1 Tax=Rhizobium laguerreae TaxID=1076926 RepID=UPI0014782222|nr:hypothetical protein [Rhizobium laguerreae]NNH85666.1 hypothetical protein [Rhizobium laguerreae]